MPFPFQVRIKPEGEKRTMSTEMETLSNNEPVEAKDTKSASQEIWKTFASSSTVHGFHFVFDSAWLPRRMTWLLLMMAASGFLIYQVHSNWKKLLKFDVVFSTEIVHAKGLPFPAVSICNQNMMRKSKIINTDAQTYLDQLDPTHLKYSKENMSASFNIEEAVSEYGHKLSEIMRDCKWLGGNRCDTKDFTIFMDFRFGLCYTFNSGNNGRVVRHVTASGSSYGLALLLDAQPEEYYGPFSYEGTGYKIFIHDQQQFPAMDSGGMDLAPGYNANIRLKRTELKSLPPPYKNKCGQKKLESNLSYSLSACHHECYALAAIKACSCRTLGMPSAAEFDRRHCTPSEIKSCIYSALGSVNFSECRCLTPCSDVLFRTQMSSAYFPSESLWNSILQQYNITANASDAVSKFQSNYRKRAVKVNVFYGSLTTEIVEERPAYTFSDLGGDLGGNMGLFLGCSLLTLCEFVDVFILICLSRWKHRN